MKIASSLPFLSLIALASCTTQPADITGCWKNLSDKTMECWEQRGDTLYGQGLAIQGHGDTLVFEELKLYSDGDVRIYSADVENNGGPVLFRETEPWVFENPEHDFPKRIAYRFIDGETIEVQVGGEGEGFTWAFQRMP